MMNGSKWKHLVPVVLVAFGLGPQYKITSSGGNIPLLIDHLRFSKGVTSNQVYSLPTSGIVGYNISLHLILQCNERC